MDESAGTSSGLEVSARADAQRQDGRSYTWMVSGAVMVLLAYSLPFLLNRLRHDPFLNVTVGNEKIYLARVVDAYRGGSLGNPYLAGHQDAERFMPELAERLLALAAHATRVDPLIMVALSRVLFPVLIYLLLWSIARGFGMKPRMATLAALLPPLVPPLPWTGIADYAAFFFRYFRAISPTFYVALLLLVLRLVQIAWKNAVWWTGLVAGAGLGLLFYATPVYYWSFAIGGVACLALFSAGRARVRMLASVLIALVIGLPFFASALHRAQVPDVQATLARLDLLTPGRAPDRDVTPRLILSALVLALVWLWRRRLGDSGRFLVPFMCVGTLLMVQNLVTNRHLQGHHWIECLIPVWSLAAMACLQSSRESFRPACATAFTAVLVSGAIFLHTIAYLHWAEAQEENREFWALDARMPRTLDWLNQHTPPNSVVIADAEVMDSLVLFTHNKVYWANFASQHVISDWEAGARTHSLEAWHPGSSTRLPFRADFYLGTDLACLSPEARQPLYRNQTEGTCILAVQ